MIVTQVGGELMIESFRLNNERHHRDSCQLVESGGFEFSAILSNHSPIVRLFLAHKSICVLGGKSLIVFLASLVDSEAN